MEIISTYTDDQAVEDGYLVALNAKDRVTCAVFNWLTETAPEGPQPPDRWPVAMMTWFRAKDAETKAIALSGGLIGTHGQVARRIYEKNIGGGIWKAYAITKNGRLTHLSEIEPKLKNTQIKTLWLFPNEVGGMTLMFPEDY